MSNPLFGLLFLFMVLGYMLGRRKGKPGLYAGVGLLAGVGAYFGVYIVAANLAY